MSRPHISLFRSTAQTVALALLVLQLVIFAVSAYYILLPMVKRSTDDLAALMVLSAQTWAELPPQTRPDFELELARKHNLWLLDNAPTLPEYKHHSPYLLLLEQALEARTGRVIRIQYTEFGKPWFWVDFPAGNDRISIGFPEDRMAAQPPIAIMLILLATLVLAVLAALILARRIVRPLQHLAGAARYVGKGGVPEKLPEDGVEELAALAKTFNTMAQEVQGLLDNRTTLLSGISHDLRTPLARMRLAVEMLPAEAGEKTIRRLQKDIDEMNRLIGEFLEFSRGLKKEEPHKQDLAALLQAMVDDKQAEGISIRWEPGRKCERMVGEMALRRIVGNLLSNAVRYGEGREIELRLSCTDNETRISVLDRGPGIPAQELENVFRPFYRIETSRSKVTGGSGLGLAITKQLADVNGWLIELLPREGGGLEARLSL